MGRPAKVSSEKVLAAARQLFAEKGFEAATLAAIGARVGLTAAAILRLAPSKEALFQKAMLGSPDDPTPRHLEFLAELTGEEDPRPVLRRMGELSVAVMEAKLGQVVALWMRARTLNPEALPLPFDPAEHPTPPERVLRQIAEYFRRADRAGTLRIGDPEAAAMAFAASLHGYVFIHRVLRAIEPPMPLDRYLDTLIDVWCSPRAAEPSKPEIA